MHILIVEDEIPAFEKLRNHLVKDLKLEFTYDWSRSVKDTLYFLNKDIEYNLIFSDVQLLDGLSFDAFSQVEIKSPIIFCSAFDDYLFKAFQENGIAYILKPYGEKEVKHAYEKYMVLFKESIHNYFNSNIFNVLKTALINQSNSYKDRFVIKGKKGIHLIETDDIVLIEAEGDFCKLYDNSGKMHMYSLNLGGIHELLNPKAFFRINRSQVIQLKYIDKIENHFKNRLQIIINSGRHKVMTSSSTTSSFRNWIEG